LDSNHQNRLEGELSITEVKQILKGRPQKLQNKGIVLATWTKVVDKRNALWKKIANTNIWQTII